MKLSQLLAIAAILTGAQAVAPLVHLGYSSYEGRSLSNGITQWLGLRYAAPPVGDLRFAAPQNPLPAEGVQDANSHGNLCLATGASGPTNTTDEDCLFLEIFAPSNATKDSKLPVYFFIQGGGFNQLSNANYNGSGLIKAADYDLITVTLNYRVGPYGFLAGSEVIESGGVNAGLKDQRKALKWVQKYIEHFGGDPCRVTIGGASAGAQSVCMHATAYGGRDDGLFHATSAESQSFPPLRTVNESQYAYDNLVIRAGCASEDDTLACLRNRTSDELQAVNNQTAFPGAQAAPLYQWGPVLDFDFVSDYTLRAYAEGKYVKVPAIYGDATNEGTNFVPNATATIGQSNTFLKNQFPDLTLPQLKKINELYPVENTPFFNNSGRYWRQASDVYGELRYNCPGIFISRNLANDNVSNWNYRWDVIDPPANASGVGVAHTVEVNAIFGPENVNGGAPASYKEGGVNNAIVDVAQAYWTSFVRTRNPNTYRKAGTPMWEQWPSGEDRRLDFQTNATRMETVDEGQRERCEYLLSIGLDLKQ
ncbi:triacylglycerol lipase like protein [Zymoseptoria brevis]|uniref:Carboxylic ester hydrolase n=1 Tax=Zymoseptoria brevis TaxID=1047168 RepID=A0A0F4GF72_9PEZI|nr:triacylglycerol lipase like protein [Zymoseptoria brevis]